MRPHPENASIQKHSGLSSISWQMVVRQMANFFMFIHRRFFMSIQGSLTGESQSAAFFGFGCKLFLEIINGFKNLGGNYYEVC